MQHCYFCFTYWSLSYSLAPPSLQKNIVCKAKGMASLLQILYSDPKLDHF